MEYITYIPPNDEIINQAQDRLRFKFPAGYIEFIKSGYDLGDSILEPLMIDPISQHLDIFSAAEEAWGQMGIPRDWLPILDSNGDYFVINQVGNVKFWSHDGMSNAEHWDTVESWKRQLKGEATK